jgi:hypothetical protein
MPASSALLRADRAAATAVAAAGSMSSFSAVTFTALTSYSYFAH